MSLVLFLFLGLILGPTFFDVSLPKDSKLLFDFAAYAFLFIAGLDLRIVVNKTQAWKALIVSLGAFFVPVLVSALFLLYFSQSVGIAERFSVSSLFFIVAISVSAVPVIIQILKSYRLYNSPLGQLVLSAAIFCDLMAWIIFFALFSQGQRANWLVGHIPILLFFCGALLSSTKLFKEPLLLKIDGFSQKFCAPLFFVGIGLQINLTKDFSFGSVALIIGLATFTKMVGSYLGSKVARLSSSEAWTVASLLNARGAMEVVMAKLALQLHLIDTRLFTSLVAMAIGTTFMVGPLMRIYNLLPLPINKVEQGC